MFLENLFPPIPSELIMPLGGFYVHQGQLHFIPVLIAGLIGTVLGAFPWYGLGRLVNEERLENWLNKYCDNFYKNCLDRHDPFEKYINEIFEKELCISPMKSLSVHITNINSSYGLSPFIDYKKIWDENDVSQKPPSYEIENEEEGDFYFSYLN